MYSPPAAMSRLITVADRSARCARPGTPDVVVRSSTSMLSFTPNGIPHSGRSRRRALDETLGGAAELSGRFDVDPDGRVTGAVDPVEHLLHDGDDIESVFVGGPQPGDPGVEGAGGPRVSHAAQPRPSAASIG